MLQQAVSALAVTLRGHREESEGVRDPVDRVEQEADVSVSTAPASLTPASRSGATSARVIRYPDGTRTRLVGVAANQIVAPPAP